MLTETSQRKAIVLDTSAFISGFDPLTLRANQYSVPQVKRELTFYSLPLLRFITAVDNGRLKVRTPSTKFVKKVENSSKRVGDKFCLSQADVQVLALAAQLRKEGFTTKIVTDDYSIQNVANQMKVEFASLATFGIRYRFFWTRYCPACRKIYSADYDSNTCRICGTELKRKATRRKPI